MDNIIRVSKPGFNAFTAEPKDLLFDSTINTLKVYIEKSDRVNVSHVASAGVSTYDITHNLGYKPILLGYYQHPDTGHWHKTTSFADSNTGAAWGLYGNLINSDLNTVQMRLYDSINEPIPSTEPVNFKVYILADPREHAWYEPASVDLGGGQPPDVGIRISRPGVDAFTAQPKDIVFDSSYPTLKIYSIVYFPGNVPSQPHGLNYPPTFIPYSESETVGGRWQSANPGYFGGGLSSVWVDHTNVYSNFTQPAYVILCSDPLNE